MGARLLSSHVAAINELRASLEEGAISDLCVTQETTVYFRIQGPNGATNFVLEAAPTYPQSGSLRLTSPNLDDLDLIPLNAKLELGSCTIMRALELLGRMVTVDLEWAVAAVDDGGFSSDADMAKLSDDDVEHDVEDAFEVDDDVLRDWSRILAQ
jgi:hypothetical protein